MGLELVGWVGWVVVFFVGSFFQIVVFLVGLLFWVGWLVAVVVSLSKFSISQLGFELVGWVVVFFSW